MDIVGTEGLASLTSFAITELHQRLTLSQETCEGEDQFGNIRKSPATEKASGN